MPLWGSGNKEDRKEQNFTSHDEESYVSSGNANFASSGSSNSGLADMQQFSMALRQQILVQTVITDLCDTAFQQCITGKPNESLSGKEAACIHSTVNKWMDTNEFIMGRLAKKQQQASGASGAF